MKQIGKEFGAEPGTGPDGYDLNVAIIASRFNHFIVDQLMT